MCHHHFKGKRCPKCGNKIKDYGKKIDAIEAELEQVGKTKKQKATTEEKARWFGMAEYHRREKGYKDGWSAWTFKDKFDVFPNHYKDAPLVEPDQKFLSWMKYRAIKWHKEKAKEKQENKQLKWC